MEKTKKKLVLAKETVRNLAPVQLRQVAGGESWACNTYPCPDYSVEFTCECTAETTVVEPQTRNC